MAGEVEWADFPLADVKDDDGRPFFRDVFDQMAADPRFVGAVRYVLGQFFETLEGSFEAMPGHQEPDLEAAAMVQAAMKRTMVEIQPLALVLTREQPLRTKFRRLMHPCIQGPPGEFIPSIAEQMRRNARGDMTIG